MAITTDDILQTKFVVTFFSRAKSADVPELLRAEWFGPFDDILDSLAPNITFHPNDHQIRLLANGVAQLNYTTNQIPLDNLQASCAELRRHPWIAKFEAEKEVELIFDQYPWPISPKLSLSLSQRPLKLALFDMDSTLINEEVIDEIARSIGISDAVSAITARAMNGDIDFATSLKERVAMLRGVPVTVWKELKKTVTVAEGARQLIAGLKERGVFTGVVSGGFTPMAEWLKEELGLDVAVANHLVEEGPNDEILYPHLSGFLDPAHPIVTPELKRDTLLSLAAAHSIKIHETMAVGDGSNDLLMLGTAGLGIAWKAKPKVQRAAPMRLNGQSLAELLYLFDHED